MRSVGTDGWLWIVGVLVSGAAAVSLWSGAARRAGGDRAGYRWLAGAAAAWCVGEVSSRLASGQVTGFIAPLTIADLFPLLALIPIVTGIVVLAGPRPPAAQQNASPAGTGFDDAARASGLPRSHRPAGAGNTPATARLTAGHRGALGLARGSQLASWQFAGQLLDGYVLASALLVIGWLTVFWTDYERSGADPRTFLLGLLLPLAGIAVLSALLPRAAAAGWRAAIPYAALAAVTAGDALGTAGRLAGAHGPGGSEEIVKVAGYLLLLAAPWLAAYRAAGPQRRPVAGDQHRPGETAHHFRATREPPAARSSPQLPAAAIISGLTAAAAALLIIASEAAGGSRVHPVVMIVGGGSVLALVVRVLGLLRENSLALTAARASDGYVRELADRSSDAVIICDFDGTVRYASPSVAAYGYAADSVVGRDLADFVHPEDRSAAAKEIRRISGSTSGDGARDRAAVTGHGAIAGSAASPDPRAPVARFHCRVLAADGTWRPIECTVSRYQQPAEHGQLLLTARDLSDQIAQKLTPLVLHDRLTGLPNRPYIEERVADTLGRRRDSLAADRDGAGAHPGNGPYPGNGPAAEPAGLPVAVVLLHVDGSAEVRDRVGHAGGDLLLTQAARRLRGAIPPPHTIARWGGDEFAVLVEGGAGASAAVDLAGQLARCVAAQPFRISGRDFAVTASVGVAFAGDSPAEDLLRDAGAAMSRAKAAGGGRVEIFAAHLHASSGGGGTDAPQQGPDVPQEGKAPAAAS